MSLICWVGLAFDVQRKSRVRMESEVEIEGQIRNKTVKKRWRCDLESDVQRKPCRIVFEVWIGSDLQQKLFRLRFATYISPKMNRNNYGEGKGAIIQATVAARPLFETSGSFHSSLKIRSAEDSYLPFYFSLRIKIFIRVVQAARASTSHRQWMKFNPQIDLSKESEASSLQSTSLNIYLTPNLLFGNHPCYRIGRGLGHACKQLRRRAK